MYNLELVTKFRHMLDELHVYGEWTHFAFARFSDTEIVFRSVPAEYWIEHVVTPGGHSGGDSRWESINQHWKGIVEEYEMLSERRISTFGYYEALHHVPPRFSERYGYSSGYMDGVSSPHRSTCHADLTYCPPTPDEPKVEKESWRIRFGKWVEYIYWRKRFIKVKFITLRDMSRCELCDGNDGCIMYHCPCNPNEQLKRKRK